MFVFTEIVLQMPLWMLLRIRNVSGQPKSNLSLKKNPFNCYGFSPLMMTTIREGLNEKKNVFFRALPESPKPRTGVQTYSYSPPN